MRKQEITVKEIKDEMNLFIFSVFHYYCYQLVLSIYLKMAFGCLYQCFSIYYFAVAILILPLLY